MTQRLRARICAFASLALACLCMFGAPSVARAAEGDYQIYPTPQAISYAKGEVKLEKKATTVVESGIDAETRARLDETLKLKGIAATASETVPQGKGTAVLVGVRGSKGAVDTYVDKLVKENKLSLTDDLFGKTDAYLLASVPDEGKIIVLGKDTDAAFYGLTTLYQIFQQVEGDTLRAFTACDYADVITRGFIEGYYGNPWSTEDRVELMRWGGHYKLNAYFYAPKDDPKHNAKWRELYTDEELTSKIEPLAKAGNESKCRFVFALHPFMSNPITNANYAESVKTLKAKFTQVMDHGVRQIAILADDAANQGNDLYIKLCNEMTNWLREQQKAKNSDGTLKYPGLKDTLIFCPVNYMGQGEAWYKQLPSNVQVINTGGRVWGKIDNKFASAFQKNSGVAPFMWINWPCSDNDKDALHMGGHNNFLGSDLKPGQVKGVVINPMQQSEPSKQGIFMNADFTWNLWESEAHANDTWEKSFSYVDHNSPIATEGSNALRSLSNHMKRMYGGGATWENGESAEIKDELNAFRSKLTADTVTADDCDKMIAIFEQIKNDAKVFRESAGTPAMLKQMEPWIATFDDLTRAAITELNAVKASISGDNNELITLFAEGTSAFDQANNHELWYINHYEKARVGKAYITPTVNALNDYVAEKATLAADPDAVVTKLVTNRTDTPVGSKDAVFDGDPTTGAEYRDPNKVAQGDYFGMTQTKPFDLDTVTFVQGSGKNFFDCSKVQYFKDGEWKDVPNAQEYTTSTVTVADLGLKQVEGVRLVAVRANKLDAWPTINEIMVNQEIETSSTFTGTVTLAKQESADTSKPLQNASDAKDNTEAWFTEKRAGEGKHDGTVKDAAVIVTFDTPKTIDAIVFKQGGNSSDVIDKGSAYWQGTDGAWHKAGDVTSDKNQTIKLSSLVEAKAIKVVNDQAKEVWWRVVDLHATYGKSAATQAITTNMPVYQTNKIERAIDGNDSTQFWSSRATQANDWVMLNFGESKYIDTVRMLQGASDCFTKSKLYYTTDKTPSQNGNWTELATLSGAADQTVAFDRVEATGIKVVATQGTANWFQLFELQAFEKFSYTKDNLYANFDLANVDLTARVGDGAFKTTDGAVTLAKKGDVIAIDLGSVRRDIKLANLDGQKLVNAELVCSQNGLEWVKSDKSNVERARYVGFRATGDNATVTFKALEGTYLFSLSPNMVKSGLPGNQTLDVSKMFDGNVTTATKSSGAPAEGSTVVIDLGQTRTINSFEYFVPEASLDFIRNAVVEIADTPDAADKDWKLVLDINSKGAIQDPGTQATAKEAGWLTHSSETPGNMFIEAKGLDLTGRYLRIRFTKAYPDRWVEIGELRINKGAYVSTYAGGDFESTVTEQQGKTPQNLIDKNLLTPWAPQGSKAGSLVYHVSAPLKADGTPCQGVRIVSHGKPSNVTVKAVLYTDDTYSKTETVELGVDNKVLKEFSFGKLKDNGRALAEYTAVKDIIFEWSEGTEPQIAEVYLLGALTGVDSDALAELQALIDTAKKQDTSTWTTDSKDALNAAISQAEEALKYPESLTADQVEDLKSAIETALNSPVLKYTGTELSELVQGALTDGSKYTASSWKAYQDALAAAQAGLEKGDNLSQAEGEQLVANLKAALDGLVLVGDGGNNGDGNQGGNGNQSGNGNQGNGGANGGNKPNGGLPQTGDPSTLLSAVALVAGGVVTASGAFAASRKRK
ncbi:beta-N-acetylglucosaminidase domain-containing protein [Collinsella stercoris]|uniref:Hyalurononglucosaminidase n=1 Tax=Collinsella stercoris DSM 13279 TaxID=445975 RepID=B6GAA9_9ACTN|nr:beta-N-acetylglucosaminidase domain-containing protein [Collinsella stercoris]EEA90799.1 hyalurononglucosaminidase [Collinsella stercoris DSM 13279]UEA45393.1 beta-N-acetylglucosaminidase domain-containing protein [Collinsella stercoris DSM 13279]UWP12082.1 beta-N-acetylglucosaminidase domain-containing protein [Collinsella stercoris]